MKISTLLLPAIIALLAAACDSATKTEPEIKKDSAAVVATPPPLPPKNDKIRNNITIKSNILKVSQAFLMDVDGKLLPDDNLVNVNQYLTLRLIIDSGWVATNNIVKLGASEKVIASDGSVILDEKDLFEGGDEVSPADANVIDIKVIIQSVNKLVDYYEVSFRVWDKIGAGDATGTYRFNIK